MTHVDTESKIPKILLFDENGRHYGIIGSYCWDKICVDKVVPSDEKPFNEKVTKRQNSLISLEVEGYDRPAGFHVTVFSQGEVILNNDIEDKLFLNIAPGVYVISVMASWSRVGDVSYLFLIEVT